MADKKSQKDDPTISTSSVASGYPEGTHPALPASEVTHSTKNVEYRDNPDKPDPTTVAQVEVRPDEQ